MEKRLIINGLPRKISRERARVSTSGTMDTLALPLGPTTDGCERLARNMPPRFEASSDLRHAHSNNAREQSGRGGLKRLVSYYAPAAGSGTKGDTGRHQQTIAKESMFRLTACLR
jgi:hypothetical protein